MTPEKNELIRFAKMVGIVCGAMIAAGTVIQAVGGFLWGYATRPIITMIREESVARQRADSLLIEQVGLLGEAIRRPGSAEGRSAAKEAAEVPELVKRRKLLNKTGGQ